MAATETAEPAAEQIRGIRIGDKVYPSPSDFTIGEAEVIKENTGLSPQDLIVGVSGDSSDPTYLRAIGWVCLSREKGKVVEWDDKRITESSVAMFFEMPDEEEGADASPPASRQKRSSSAKPTT